MAAQMFSRPLVDSLRVLCWLYKLGRGEVEDQRFKEARRAELVNRSDVRLLWGQYIVNRKVTVD